MEIPTKLFRVEGYKGFKFSVDKKAVQMVGGSIGFQASAYSNGWNGAYYRATGNTRLTAFENLLSKMTIVRVVSAQA